MDGSQPLDPRKTIFVGGVPRPLRAGKENFTEIFEMNYFQYSIIAYLKMFKYLNHNQILHLS